MQTIKELRKLFARYGLPECVVSDNGPQLVSDDMKKFFRNNGIRHSLSPPYHPATNGAAERCVQTVKSALKKHLLCDKQATDLSHALQNFLLHYRVTPHATTGRAPADMFLQRSPRTRFSLLKPDVTSTVHQKQEVQVRNHKSSTKVPNTYSVGEIVRVKNVHSGIERFVKGVVAKVLGPYHFLVKIGNRCRYVHIEHLRKTGELYLDQRPTVQNDVMDYPLTFEDSDLSRFDAPASEVPQPPVVSNTETCNSEPVFKPATTVPPVASPSVAQRPVATPTKSSSPRRSGRQVKRPERLIEQI
jgi:hypothetical protein